MVLDLSTYHFTVRHTSGQTNTVADTLSRMVNAVFVQRANDSYLCEVQCKDAKLVTIIKDIEAATETGNQSKAGKSYQVVNGMLMHSITQHGKTIQRVVVPKSLLSALMQSHHDHAGHGDALRTKSKLSKCYYWQNMDQDIAHCRRSYEVHCHTGSAEQVCIIYVIEFKEEEIVTKFGVPNNTIRDIDSAFTSKTTNDYLHHRHIEHTLTVPYAPRTNGLVVRANGGILPPLRKNVNGDVDHWSEYLAKTTFEVNAQFHAGLKISPIELLFNYTPRRIIDNQLQVDIHEPH
ncbi:hypothetical protein MRX96_027927 [Rhipicephalus microplus]